MNIFFRPHEMSAVYAMRTNNKDTREVRNGARLVCSLAISVSNANKRQKSNEAPFARMYVCTRAHLHLAKFLMPTESIGEGDMWEVHWPTTFSFTTTVQMGTNESRTHANSATTTRLGDTDTHILYAAAAAAAGQDSQCTMYVFDASANRTFFISFALWSLSLCGFRHSNATTRIINYILFAPNCTIQRNTLDRPSAATTGGVPAVIAAKNLPKDKCSVMFCHTFVVARCKRFLLFIWKIASPMCHKKWRK